MWHRRIYGTLTPRVQCTRTKRILENSQISLAANAQQLARELTYSTILDACMIKFKRNKNEEEISRLYRITVTETAHFIWKLRCERRIGNGDTPKSSTLPQK
jgi:hypothetical protein